MGGRQILAVVLAVAGVITLGIGVAGLLSGDDVVRSSDGAASSTGSPEPADTASASPAPTPGESPAESPSPSPSPEPLETPEEFFSRFTDALRSGKGAFLLARLHPFVLDRYAESDCRAYLGGLDFPEYDVEVLSVGRPKVFLWKTDGVRRDIAHATTVRIRFTEDGNTFVETDTHLVARDDGSFLFLSDCGAPKAGAA